MKRWLRRVRGALGMAVAWAVAWGAAGVLVTLGFVLSTGGRPDAPFPIMLAGAGFIAGAVFSAVLGLAEGRRRFEQMSLARFAAWGGAAGFTLAAAFVVAIGLAGDATFLWNLLTVGPLFAVGAAGCAAGSLALARKAQPHARLDPPDAAAAPALEHGVGRRARRDER